MFLTSDDFNVIIEADQLSKILGNNPQLLDECILIAVDEMAEHLSGRYDTTELFNATGDTRNPSIVMKCADIALYHLYSRIAPRNIPDLRRDRYEKFIDWAKMVQKGNVHLNLPIKPINNQTTYLLFGGNPTFRFR